MNNTILLSITSDKEGDLLLVIIFVILVSTLGMKILQYNREAVIKLSEAAQELNNKTLHQSADLFFKLYKIRAICTYITIAVSIILLLVSIQITYS